MRTLEKSLTTSYPFHAKSRFCQLPQINYQGGNRCGQTPNWLLKCPFFSFFFPPVLLRLVLQLLLSPLHRKLGAESITVLTLNMCFAHYKHSLASLYKLFLPPPERNTDGLLLIPFLPPRELWNSVPRARACGDKWDRIRLHSYGMMSLRNWEWKSKRTLSKETHSSTETNTLSHSVSCVCLCSLLFLPGLHSVQLQPCRFLPHTLKK